MKFGVSIVLLFLALFSEAQERLEFPFQLLDGWAILLEGTLGGLGHQKMLIDTGAVPSAISMRVAKKLGLSGSIQELSLMNRSIDVERVRVPDVRIGAVTAEAFYMVAMDFRRIEQALGTRIDGVIGLDLLARRNFKLDYRRKEILFDVDVDGAGAVEFETENEASGIYVTVPLQIGEARLQMIVDTGTKDLMLFQRRLNSNLKQLSVHVIHDQVSSLNAGGKDSVAEVEMRSVSMGRLSRQKQKALLWKTPDGNLRKFDGLLGPTALGATRVAFDFKRHVVSFETD